MAKPTLNEILDFIKYFITEPFISLYKEIKELLKDLFNKRVWAMIWGITCLVMFFLRRSAVSIICGIMFLIFTVIYEWQKGEFREKARKRLYHKMGINRIKKKKEN